MTHLIPSILSSMAVRRKKKKTFLISCSPFATNNFANTLLSATYRFMQFRPLSGHSPISINCVLVLVCNVRSARNWLYDWFFIQCLRWWWFLLHHRHHMHCCRRCRLPGRTSPFETEAMQNNSAWRAHSQPKMPNKLHNVESWTGLHIELKMDEQKKGRKKSGRKLFSTIPPIENNFQRNCMLHRCPGKATAKAKGRFIILMGLLMLQYAWCTTERQALTHTMPNKRCHDTTNAEPSVDLHSAHERRDAKAKDNWEKAGLHYMR